LRTSGGLSTGGIVGVGVIGIAGVVTTTLEVTVENGVELLINGDETEDRSDREVERIRVDDGDDVGEELTDEEMAVNVERDDTLEVAGNSAVEVATVELTKLEVGLSRVTTDVTLLITSDDVGEKNSDVAMPVAVTAITELAKGV
jgi:hypothetical protein